MEEIQREEAEKGEVKEEDKYGGALEELQEEVFQGEVDIGGGLETQPEWEHIQKKDP